MKTRSSSDPRCLIGLETDTDRGAIDVVHACAFPTETEANLVCALRARGHLATSLVAEVDGAVVGHIAFSPVATADPATPASGLGPVAVLRGFRRRGIACELVRRGLELRRAAGDELVVVLGDPEYYRRFGFVPASLHGISSDFGGGDAFRVLELTDGAARRATGRVRYAEPFSSVGVEDDHGADSSEGSQPQVGMILAVGQNGGIGRAGRVPWDYPSDRAFFARTTRGHAVLMGRRTWEETSAPLPGRLNVVVSTTLADLEGADVVPCLADALEVSRRARTFAFVIGGARLFAEATPLARRVYYTAIPESPPEADVSFRLDRDRFCEIDSWMGARGERYFILGRARV
jgi:putative acetyltransferase